MFVFFENGFHRSLMKSINLLKQQKNLKNFKKLFLSFLIVFVIQEPFRVFEVLRMLEGNRVYTP
jgi:hypothetical protein